MFFQKKDIRICICGGYRSRQIVYRKIYDEIKEYRYQFGNHDFCEFVKYKRINNDASRCYINLLSSAELVRGNRYDIALIDTKIDPKFHNQIRLSLRQNSVIPKEKQLQFFDLDGDKVWFESEYIHERNMDKLYQALQNFSRRSIEMMDNMEKIHKMFPEYISCIHDYDAYCMMEDKKRVEEQMLDNYGRCTGEMPENSFNTIKSIKDWLDTNSVIKWRTKPYDRTDLYTVKDILDILVNDMSTHISKMCENAIYVDFTKEERKDEEPMNNLEVKVDIGKIRVPAITNIEILKTPNKETGVEEPKVTKITFVDGTNMKMVCHEEDTFDLRRCLFIAIAKKLFKDRYTWEGIEYKATELSYLKSANRVVDKALKDYNNKIKEAEKAVKEEAEKKRAAENQKRKHAEYVKRRDERRQKEIDEKNRQQFEYDVAVQVEAARRIKEMNPEYQVEKFCDDFCRNEENV